MNPAPTGLLVRALRCPGDLPSWPLQAWTRLVSQARRAGLLARLACALDQAGLIDRVPPAPRAHLRSARRLAAAQQEEVRREVHQIHRVLEPLGVPVVLLKGAAYVMADLSAASGRLFGDIDILVPEARLGEVEALLMGQGWATTHASAYDQRYYRQWMHELPPLRHIHRQTVLDVHHAVLPRTARLKPSSARLLAASRALAADPGLRVLAPVDMVLHGMAHLFHNEEFSRGLRDLSDLDLLLRQQGARPGFWSELLQRGRELDLGRPLYYGLRHANRILGTPVPDAILAASEDFAPARPVRWVMDRLWDRGLCPAAEADDGSAAVARGLLYLRAHWLRMPPFLLLRHLTVKALRRPGQPAAA